MPPESQPPSACSAPLVVQRSHSLEDGRGHAHGAQPGSQQPASQTPVGIEPPRGAAAARVRAAGVVPSYESCVMLPELWLPSGSHNHCLCRQPFFTPRTGAWIVPGRACKLFGWNRSRYVGQSNHPCCWGCCAADELCPLNSFLHCSSSSSSTATSALELSSGSYCKDRALFRFGLASTRRITRCPFRWNFFFLHTRERFGWN